MSDNKTISPQPEEQDPFMIHLKNASDIVHSWPAWKQAVLGGTVNVVNSNTTGSAQTLHEEPKSSND